MIFHILIAILIFCIAAAIWLWRLPGQKQLNLADRLYPARGRFNGGIIRGIAYGADPIHQLDIYRPEDGDAARTAILFFHGGSWRDGGRTDYGFVGRNFAARGFITIIADYRKLPDHAFPSYIEDAAAAAHWAHENIAAFGGDPQQIFLMGHSAGAHIATLAGLDPRWLSAHGKAPSILAGIIGISGPYNFLPFAKGAEADQAMGNWPDLMETQPIHYANKAAPPLLLLTGMEDKTVYPRNSISLHEAIDAAGGTSSIKQYPGIDHVGTIMAISRPFRARASILDDAVHFIQSGRSAPLQ